MKKENTDLVVKDKLHKLLKVVRPDLADAPAIKILEATKTDQNVADILNALHFMKTKIAIDILVKQYDAIAKPRNLH